jgi:hypothetical protein
MKTEAQFFVVFVEERYTSIMQAVDMFEDFKVIGIEEVLTISYKEKESLDWDRAKKVLDAMAEKSNGKVAFAHLLSIESDGEKRINTGKVKPWSNPKIKAISNGTKWYTIYDLEEKFQYNENH